MRREACEKPLGGVDIVWRLAVGERTTRGVAARSIVVLRLTLLPVVLIVVVLRIVIITIARLWRGSDDIEAGRRRLQVDTRGSGILPQLGVQG